MLSWRITNRINIEAYDVTNGIIKLQARDASARRLDDHHWPAWVQLFEQGISASHRLDFDFAPFRLIHALVAAEAGMVFERGHNSPKQRFVAWRFDGGSFAQIKPAMEPVLCGGVLHFLLSRKTILIPGAAQGAGT